MARNWCAVAVPLSCLKGSPERPKAASHTEHFSGCGARPLQARLATVSLHGLPSCCSQLTPHNIWALRLGPAPARLPVCNGGYHQVAQLLRLEFTQFGLRLNCKLACLCSDFLTLLPTTKRGTVNPCPNCCEHNPKPLSPVRPKEPGCP